MWRLWPTRALKVSTNVEAVASKALKVSHNVEAVTSRGSSVRWLVWACTKGEYYIQ
jgi:hypothetical protein